MLAKGKEALNDIFNESAVKYSYLTSINKPLATYQPCDYNIACPCESKTWPTNKPLAKYQSGDYNIACPCESKTWPTDKSLATYQSGDYNIACPCESKTWSTDKPLATYQSGDYNIACPWESKTWPTNKPLATYQSGNYNIACPWESKTWSTAGRKDSFLTVILKTQVNAVRSVPILSTTGISAISTPCLESQSCHLIPLCYLLSCSSA